MRFEFVWKGKKEKLEVRVCDNPFSRASGLMFRKKSKPLLFKFKHPTRIAIHSFFCVPFVSIWFLDGKIIDKKFVMPWKPTIKPNEKFDMFLEIPSNIPDFKRFLDDMRKL